MKNERSWRLQGRKYVVLGNPIKADISKQNYSVIPLTKYQDTELVCRKCKQWFIFTAKEQKYWYEDLQFWVDSVPNKCQACRFQKRVYDDLIGGLGKLIHDTENIEHNKEEIEHLIEQIIFRKMKLSQSFYPKILESMQKIKIDHYDTLKAKLKKQIT